MLKPHVIVRYFLIFCFLFASLTLAAGEQELLKKQDIDKIMDQILQQHVEKKAVSSQIIKKAFTIYIDQFDPERTYLLQQEVQPYEEMSDSQIDTILAQYKNKDFSAFENLNKTIGRAIYRARTDRTNLLNDPSLFKKAPTNEALSEFYDPDLKQPFAKTAEELKNQTRDHFAKFINAERKRYGEAQVLKHEPQLLSFYEKEIRNHENQYLTADEVGHLLSPAEQENLFTLHVLKALASSLDAHTTFFNAAEAYDMKVRLEKEFQGIGISMQEKPEGIVITALLEGGPAAKSGLVKVNDQIVEIDGKAVSGIPFEEISDKLRGKNGTTVTLLLKREVAEDRDNPTKLATVQLKREDIIVNDERVDTSYDTFGNGIIGKVTLHAFYQGENGISSEKDVREAIKKLQAAGNLRGLILDLRDNSGGFLNQAVKVAGLFISNGVVVISKYSNGEERFYRDMDGKPVYTGPLIVLTSKATASAAEIVAQALQDYGVALVVGDEHTYGKGTIQSQTVTENHGGSFFKVTVGKYYTVSGKTPQIVGVKSDILVPSQYSHEHIGEEYLQYPLKADTIASAFDDPLTDIDPNLKPWYLRYYTPTLQHKVDTWRGMVPQLNKNSEFRIAHNKNYQMFLKTINGEKIEDNPDEVVDEFDPPNKDKKNFGTEDLQMSEAVNIVKDMIYLQRHPDKGPNLTSTGTTATIPTTRK